MVSQLTGSPVAVVMEAVALTLVRELGPVLGALMVTGRAGSALTAELLPRGDGVCGGGVAHTTGPDERLFMDERIRELERRYDDLSSLLALTEEEVAAPADLHHLARLLQAGAHLLLVAEQAQQNPSLCAMGGLTPYPVLSAIRHFPEDFQLQAAGAA